MTNTGTNGNGAAQFTLHRLENGLQILAQRMPDLESVSVCYFVRTGARDEPDPALYGVSHFLEHMVFKGTARRSTEQITLDFNAMGAEFNAFTSTEQTVYYARVLGEYLPQALDLLSDMMRPRLDAHDFDLERNVILEEIARAEDVPMGQAYRKLLQTYFAGHALGHDVLGTRESIGALAVEQMRAYQARRYAANNLLLAVAGNLEWDELLALAERHTAGWSAGEMGRVAEQFVPQPGAAVVVKPQLKQQILLLATPSIGIEDPDLYAAELAAMVLGDGGGSRLYWNIYQKGLAETAGASLSAFDHTGMLVTILSTTPDHAPAVLELARAELKGLEDDGVQPDELRRAKDKLISRTVLDGDSAYGRMQALAYTWVAEGRVRSIAEEVAAIEAVTLEDVRRVLGRFPLTERQVITAYGPLEAAALGVAG
ncbi:MAG TPA: pitrilysin family protein [Ktedonobacterales bacterium]|nr:pitrilysin family protein [Ktedonobacterales bacterium]